jgi:transcription termination/antitermination protein NusG
MNTIAFTTTPRTDYSAVPLQVCPPTHIPWYAAYTIAKHEKRVVQQLEERQIQSLVPTYRSVRRLKDRKKILELPLFPSYVFVQMNAHSRLQILSLPGVLGLVCFQGKPAPIDRVEIDNLRQGLADRTIVHPHPYLKAGRRVRIRTGSLTGVEGVLVRKKDCARVVLSISLLQRSVSVDIDEADVEPV